MSKEKEVEYVASSLNIRYTLPTGIVTMLAKVSKSSEQDVWLELSNMANICAHRLSGQKRDRGDSWTQKDFPGTGIKLRIDMHKHTWGNKTGYDARIKISGQSTQTFTQKQINDYVVEGILLGEDEDEPVA